LPLVSIVEAVGDVAARDGVRRLGLFGTRFTMEASFYSEMLARRGIDVVRPRPDEIDRIHEWYVGELVRGVFKGDTRIGIVRIAERLRDEDGVDGVILAGTELPLLLRDTNVPGLKLIDSTLAHVEAIVTRLAADTSTTSPH
jgi:aspartate racemase